MVRERKMLLTKRSGAFQCYLWNKLLLQRLLNSNSHGNGHTDHGVVACAQEAHHLDVRGNGGGACELR